MEDVITEITSANNEMALKHINNGKATGPDNLPIEVWMSLARTGVNCLIEAWNKITDEAKIIDIWRGKTFLNYRGIKLTCHSLTLYERVLEHRLINIVSISEDQFGFVKGKPTTDAIFALQQLQER